MNKRSFVGKLLLVVVMCWMNLTGNAQKKSPKVDFMTSVLVDTFNPQFYLIPVKVKFKDTNVVWLGYKDALALYNYCNTKYGWDRDELIKRVRAMVLGDQVWATNDSAFFPVGRFIPLTECDCLYNENSEQIRQRALDENYYRYPDKRYNCFIYSCFKNKVALMEQDDGHIEVRNDDYYLELK